MKPRSPSSPESVASARRGGQAGMLAVLLALFLDLLWRATIAPPGVPSLPESVVAAVARLTPTSLFGWATENFGSLAQNTLWAIVLIGTVLLGYGAGYVASRSAGSDFTQRLKVSAPIAVILFLVIAAVILPIAREGFFGSANPNQALLLAQAVIFVAIWALAWAGSGSRRTVTRGDDGRATGSKRRPVATLRTAQPLHRRACRWRRVSRLAPGTES